MQLVAILVSEELALLLGLKIDLPEQDGIATAASKESSQVTQELVRVEPGVLRATSSLEKERYSVHTETREPEL